MVGPLISLSCGMREERDLSRGPVSEELSVLITQVLAGSPIRAWVWLGEAVYSKGAKHRARECRPGVIRSQVWD